MCTDNRLYWLGTHRPDNHRHRRRSDTVTGWPINKQTVNTLTQKQLPMQFAFANSAGIREWPQIVVSKYRPPATTASTARSHWMPISLTTRPSGTVVDGNYLSSATRSNTRIGLHWLEPLIAHIIIKKWMGIMTFKTKRRHSTKVQWRRLVVSSSVYLNNFDTNWFSSFDVALLVPMCVPQSPQTCVPPLVVKGIERSPRVINSLQ